MINKIMEFLSKDEVELVLESMLAVIVYFETKNLALTGAILVLIINNFFTRTQAKSNAEMLLNHNNLFLTDNKILLDHEKRILKLEEDK